MVHPKLFLLLAIFILILTPIQGEDEESSMSRDDETNATETRDTNKTGKSLLKVVDISKSWMCL